MRKSSTISGSKPGPFILPVSTLMRKDTHMKKSKSNSPTSSLKFHSTLEGSVSGTRSPGSLSYKGLKCKSPSCRSDCLGGYIRRTASLDAIYLKGHWPKDAFTMHSVILKVNRATQTDESGSDRKPRHADLGSDDVKYEKYIRHRLQKVNKDTQSSPKIGLRLVSPSLQTEYGSGGSQTPPGSVLPNLIRSGPQSPIHGIPLNISMKTSLGRALMRNSIEGLNQEIERLILKDIDDRFFNCNSIPEGHRAPPPDILRLTRTVNTQTPGNDDLEGDFAASDPPSRDSGSPSVYGNIDLHTPPNYHSQGSRGSSPDDFNKFGTSPHINRFLAREPPDGCERVNLKLELSRRQSADSGKIDFIPLKPMSTTFQFKPSLGSAFHPLHSDHSGVMGHSSAGLDVPCVRDDGEDINTRTADQSEVNSSSSSSPPSSSEAKPRND